jgi:hypothetical protein
MGTFLKFQVGGGLAKNVAKTGGLAVNASFVTQTLRDVDLCGSIN